MNYMKELHKNKNKLRRFRFGPKKYDDQKYRKPVKKGIAPYGNYHLRGKNSRIKKAYGIPF